MSEFDDAVVASMKPNPAQAARVGFSAAVDSNPDSVAEAKRVAQRTGVPIDTVLNMPAEMKRQDAVGSVDFDTLAQTSPATAALLADVDKARLSHDNVDSLSGMEQLIRSVKRGFTAGMRGRDAEAIDDSARILTAIDTLERGGALSPNDPLASMFAGSSGSPESLAKMRAKHQARVTENASDYGKRTQGLAQLMPTGSTADFYQAKGWGDSLSALLSDPFEVGANVAVESLGLMAPAFPLIAGGGLAGGARGLAGMAGATSTNAEYSTAVAEALQASGVDLNNIEAVQAAVATPEFADTRRKAQIKAATIGAFDAATAGMAGVRLRPSMAGNLAAQTGVQAAGGAAGEAAGSVASGQEVNASSVLAEAIGEIPGAFVDVATMAGRQMVQGQRKAEQADQQAAFIENINQLVAADKLLQRDPETFQTFIAAAAEDGPVQNVFIDGKTLMQSGMAPALADLSPAVRDQLDRAILTGGQIAIPVDEYAARIAPTDLAPQLLDHLKTDAEGFSRAEAADFMANQGAELQAEVERVIGNQADADTFRASQDVVKADILGQLNTAGRFTPQVNEAYATLASAYSAVRAAQLGMTPEAFHAERGMRVQGAAVAGQQFSQGELTNLGINYDSRAPIGDFIDGLEYVAEGSESIVYRDGDRAIKISEPYSDNSEETFNARVNAALLIDRVLGDGTLQVVGYYESKNGTRNPVFSQAWVEGRAATREEIQDLMLARGFEIAEAGRVTDTFKKTINGVTVIAKDLDGDNVKVGESGNAAVIDAALLTENTEGKREALTSEQAQAIIQPLNQSGQLAPADPNILNQSGNPTGKDSFTVRPPKKLYRGVAKGVQQSGADGIGTYMLGKGLYSSPSKRFAKMYGEVVEVSAEEYFPRNPLVLDQPRGYSAPDVFRDWLFDVHGFKNLREFNAKYPDPGDFVRSLGYDGVVIGDEIVRYPSDNILNQPDDGAGANRGGFSPNMFEVFKGDKLLGYVQADSRDAATQKAGNTPKLAGFDKVAEHPVGLVTLLQNADLSTFLHESAHYFFESDIQLASELMGKTDLTPGEQQIVDDVSKLLTWHGIQGDVTEQLRQWHTMDFEEQRSHHERTAESFEAYLFSGQAPNLELQPIFQRFRAWMVNVYKSISDFLKKNPEAGKLSDEVRSVFDRMIATQEQIQLAEQARSLTALFASPETSGMTPEAYAAYQALGVDATNTAIEELQAKGLRDMQWLANARGREVKKLQKESKAARAEVTMEARREVMSQPVYRAWDFLTGKAGEKTEAQTENELEVADWKQRRQEAMDAARAQAKTEAWDNSDESKQDYDSGRAKGMAKGQLLARQKKDIDLIVARAALDWDRANPRPVAAQDSNVFDLGEQVFGKINRAALEDIGVPEEITAHIRKLRMTATDGMHPDQIAEIFEFSSGDELVRTLAAAPPPKEAINALAEQMMLERFGELASPDAIERAADQAIHNDVRARMLATEVNALAQAIGKPKILASAAKAFAADMIARLKVRDVRPGQYANAEAKASKAADKAHKAGDTALAASEKRNQIIQHYATRAAYDAQDEVKATMRAWSKLVARKDSTKSTDIDLLNAVRAILGEYGIAPKRAERASEYLKSVQAYDPEMYAVIQGVVERAEANAKPVKELTLMEFRGLRDEIDSIMHLAKRSRQMEIDGDLLDIQDIQADLVQRMTDYGIPDKIPGEGQAVTPGEQRMNKFKSLLAFARRVESWAGQMDGTQAMGPFRRFVWSRISDAAVAYRTDKAVYLKQFRALVEAIAPTLKPTLIHSPELGYTFGKDSGGSAINEILHAILHTGNESNKRKMLLGRGWAVEVAPGQLDTTRWDAFIARLVAEGKLTPAHYDFAQGVWDLLDSMKPLAQKTHRDVFGRYFDEVTANPFTDPFGVTRAGGYVPAMVDSRVVKDAELRKLADEDNAAMSYAFPTTPKGFTQARTEYNKPLMLDLRTLGQHIDKVLLFSHMEMPVRDVQRVLSKQVGETLNRIDQTAISGMLLPWLNRSAKQQVETPIAGSAGTMRFFSVMRSRAGMAAMFGNLANTVQQLTGFSLAAVKVKPGLLLSATADFVKSPREFAKTVSETSAYMNTRMANEVYAMTDAINDILLNPSLLEKGQAWAMRHAYFLQSAMDNSMSPIIWTAAYNQAKQAGETHDDAVRLADGTVRQTQGAMQAEDISRIEGGNAFVRMFTQFAGYFNMNANLLGTEYVKLMHDGGLRKNAGRGVFLFAFGYMVPAVVGELIIQAFRGGPGDDDDDGEYLDDWLAAVFGWAPLRYATAMVPVGGAVMNAAVNAWNGKPYDDRISTSPAISMLESAARAPVSVFKAIEGDGSAQKAVRDVATLMSMTLGLPANLAARPIGYMAGVMDRATEPTSGFDMARGILTGQVSPDSKN